MGLLIPIVVYLILDLYFNITIKPEMPLEVYQNIYT